MILYITLGAFFNVKVVHVYGTSVNINVDKFTVHCN